MVQDKEAFLGNVVKISDAIFVAFAFVAAYFLSFLVRNILGLGEFYYASAPTLHAFYFSRTSISLSPLPAYQPGCYCYPFWVHIEIYEPKHS